MLGLTISADTTTYAGGIENNIPLTAELFNLNDGTLTWSVTDGDGNALTETTLNIDASDTTKATLNISAAETAKNMNVTAVYKLNDSDKEYTATIELENTNIETTDDQSAQAYAILTDDGSGNGTYAMTLVRSAEDLTNNSTYNGQSILTKYTLKETNRRAPWDDDTYLRELVTSVTFANKISPASTY